MICGTLVKTGVLVTGVGLLAGGVAFGPELASYATSSVRQVRTEVKNSVPVEFELQRAKDLLDDILPEMHANVRRIAEEEVSLAQLKEDVAKHRDAIDTEKVQLTKLRDMVTTQQVSYAVNGRNVRHDEVRNELSRRLDRIKEASVVLAGKERLLVSREQVLAAAIDRLEKTRSQKVVLQDRIASLEAQHELVKSASVGTAVAIDNTKLAQTEKLIADIKNRLDVSERVLARQAAFVDPFTVEVVNERDLVAEVDAYLTGEPADLDVDPKQLVFQDTGTIEPLN